MTPIPNTTLKSEPPTLQRCRRLFEFIGKEPNDAVYVLQIVA